MKQSVYTALAGSGHVPLTLRIGVAGHRPNNLMPEKLSQYREHITEVYAQVMAVLVNLQSHAAAAGAMDAAKDPVVRLISSLAEGADRILVSPDLAPEQAQLACVLPFEESRYKKDFVTGKSLQHGDSVEEFEQLLQRADYGTPDSRVLELTDTADLSSEAYRRAGEAVVHHSDLLIALFDGEPRDEGGTWSTILAAQRCSVPVIVIDSTAQKPPRLWPALPASEAGQPVELTSATLYAALSKSLMLEVDDGDAGDSHAIAQFAGETGLEHPAVTDGASPTIVHKGLAAHWTPPAFSLLKRLLAGNKSVRKIYDSWIEESTPIIEDASRYKPGTRTSAQNRVNAAYHRADALAVHYATAHRNTFVAIYLLGTGALIAAALGLAGLALVSTTDSPSAAIKHLPLACVAVEFVLLLLILALYNRDHSLKFHQKWLEYRSLAELLRPQAFFVMAGCASGLSLLKRIYRLYHEANFGPDDHSDRWVYAYAGNVVRWAGFDAGRCDLVSRQRNTSAIIRQWLLPQVDYHEQNSARMQILESRLAALGVASFWLTLGIVTAKLIDKLWYPAIPVFQIIAGFLAAFFPIVGAFAFAVRNHAEFGISVKRSLAMRKVYVRSILNLANAEASREEQISAMERVFSSAISESDEWRAIYEVKESEKA